MEPTPCTTTDEKKKVKGLEFGVRGVGRGMFVVEPELASSAASATSGPASSSGAV